jgi:polyhydroxyalkanoate synthase
MNEPKPVATGDSAACWPPEVPRISDLDRLLHAAQSRFSAGLGPEALALPYLDWALHLANAPFRQLELAGLAWLGALRFPMAALGFEPIEPSPTDHRFANGAWSKWPFSLVEQGFLAVEQWWDQAASGLPGLDPTNARVVAFAARQWLDTLSPSNAPWINPEVLSRTVRTGGLNFVEGAGHWLEDLQAVATGREPPKPLEVGRDLAVTPGKVIFRNELIELIQYQPTTAEVRPEPVLIVPAWIMKYYVLDLSPRDSLVKWLVDQGHTVFCISWRNPDASMRDTGFIDYRRRGVLAALDVVEAVTPGAKVHACGYCLGGTLLSVAASALARDGDERLASVTLLCAQVDFTDAGELQLFTTRAEAAFLDDLMWRQGYLDGSQMAGVFQLLRSNDLIWSRMLKRYWLGEDEHPSDLMAWNADTTRMPYRMHSEYLRWFFLNDDFAEGRLQVDGRPASFSDIKAPLFVVSTEKDHIAPWRSVYKAHLLNPGEIDFILSSGGHNAGVVNPPGEKQRYFRERVRKAGRPYVGPDEWYATTEPQEGSWWPAWERWLDARSGPPVPPPAMGAPEAGYAPLEDAPGRYVFQM